MLFQQIQKAYGASIKHGDLAQDDNLARMVPPGRWARMRNTTLHEMDEAAIYVLNTEAAAYADSFREDLTTGGPDPRSIRAVSRLLSEVNLPHDLTWVEFEQAKLKEHRLSRGYRLKEDAGLDECGTCGFLLDGRSKASVYVTFFKSDGRTGGVIDPLTSLRIERGEDGRPDMSACSSIHQPYVNQLLDALGATVAQRDSMLEQEFRHATYEIAIPYLFFAMIASQDTGIEFERRRMKTWHLPDRASATKRIRGKKSTQSYTAVRLGKQGRWHLSEKAARKSHGAGTEAATEGGSSIGRWLGKYERHYKGGRIIPGRHRDEKAGSDPDI